MAKNKISEWSATAANNTDVGGIDIAEGCAPSGINNAIREMMAQIKDQQAGTDADNFTVGGNLIVTGTTTATGAITATGGVIGNASTASGLSATLAVSSGGTGITSVGTSGNVLTSNGTAWVSSAPAASGFPSGTRMSFNQTSAPTGWTKDTTAAINDAVLRLVTGTVSSGGSGAFSTWNSGGTTDAYTLATADIPSHTHGVAAPSNQGSTATATSNYFSGNNTNKISGATGGGGSHSHTLSNNIKYYDFIIASKD